MADVYIDPSNGKIYWNDGSNAESIAIDGNTQNKINIIGYSAVFSPGSSPAGALTLATFNDNSGTDAFVPGTTGYSLGSSTLRWKTYATTGDFNSAVNISDTTATGSSNTGALIVSGGAAVGQSFSIGGRLQIFNGANYSAFRFSGTANTVYTLPGNSPQSSAGTSVLSSTIDGTMSWIGIVGNATTAANLNTVSATTDTTHYLLFSPINGGSGVAVSSGIGLTFNPSTGLATIGGTASITQRLTIGSNLNSTSTTTGALVNSGGLGIAGNAFIGGTVTITNTTTVDSPFGGALNVVGGIGASDVWAYSRIGTGTSASTVSRTEQFSIGTDLGFRIFETTGGQPRVNLARNAAGTNVPALAFQNTSGQFSSTGAAIGVPDSTTTATLVIYTSNGTSGNIPRVRISGGSSFVNINQMILGGDTSATATTSYIRGVDGTGTDIAANEIILQAGRSTGTGSIAGIRFFIANPASSTGSALNTALEVARLNPIQSASSASTASFTVNGGVGITGNAFIGGTVNITNTTNSTATNSGALVVSGGSAVGQSLSIGGFLQIFNGANYSSFRYTGIANTVYTLPANSPQSASGTSVLSSTIDGTMTWVGMGAGGGSGSVSSGTAPRMAYYATTGTAITDTYGINYNNTGTASTFTVFGGASLGSTVFIVQALSATSVKVGIGLTNPAYELEIVGELSATNKSFVIDHPTKPGMKLRYGSLEGPENGVYVRGILKDSNIIETPDHWTGLIDPDTITVHLTSIGKYQELYVEKIEDFKIFVVSNNGAINCYYSIWAERKDIPKLIVEY